MSTEKQYQTELLYDEDYFVRAAEAALFAYGSPMKYGRLAEAIGAEEKDVPKILNAMMSRYENSALEVVIMDGFAGLVTKSVYASVVQGALEIRRNQPLSRAALEVLAIIAYNQPATRALIEKVRGVESSSVVLSLCDKGLIEERGRLDAPGRPMLYGTTPLFLRTFGLETLSELEQGVPELAEFSRQIAEQKDTLQLPERAESGRSSRIPDGQLSLDAAANATEADEASDEQPEEDHV